MSIKKTAIITIFVSAIFISASLMIARAYEPLVRIPGLPATGDINLSQYVVGLYNFLLSIVGIVAVMMLIIGGMKYITAAGNAATVADAKDTIQNAIFGLLLALLSWVIVSAINPDVLYIKNPTSSFDDVVNVDHSACGTYDGAIPSCECKNGVFILPAPANQAACHAACSSPPSYCGLSDPSPCIKMGSSNEQRLDDLGVRWCYCVDDVHVISLAPIGTECNEICQTPAMVNPNGYHCLKADLRVGIDPNIPLMPIDEIAKYAIYNPSEESPIEIAEGSVFVFNGERSISGNPVALWEFDLDADNIFEWPIPGAADPYIFSARTYAGLAAIPLCTTSSSPTAVICPMRFKVTDNAGNSKQDVVYIRILAP